MNLVLTGNHVFTGCGPAPEALAVFVEGDRITKVCARDDMKSFLGKETKVVDCGDSLIMPGFFDGHEHAFLGGIFSRAVDLSSSGSEKEAALMVKEYADSHPELSWIIGTDWSTVSWNTSKLPDRYSLDELLPDRPVYLTDSESHSAWINTAAIRESGLINNTTLPPRLVPRDTDGIPTGFIAEEAMLAVARYAYDLPMPIQGTILDEFQQKASSLGITSVSNIQCYQGSDIDLGNVEIIRQFENEGKLNVRFFVAVGLTGDLARARKLRDMYKSDMFSFSALKHIVDGTATGWTALMLEPYSDRPDSCGGSRISGQELEERILAADKEGFRVRLHACGDGSVRRGLDCFEAAIKQNGRRDSRHTIEHIEIIKKEDIPRFKELGVIASMQPDHISICPRFSDNPYFSRIGKERCKGTWPIKSIMDSGAHVQFGTDFPIYDNNPMLAVYRATTRVFDDGEPAGGWNPEEKIDMASTLKAYTSGSAYGAFMENKLGTISEGRLADIVVLSKNLFDLEDPGEILKTNALLTVSNGRIVFER